MTSGRLVYAIFSEEATKILSIPVFINDYNIYIGAVDIIN
jgi:hypothetical protein